MKIRFFILALMLLAGNGVAWAHALLDHAEPKVGDTMHAAPKEVKIWFTEKLEGAFSYIQVFDEAGNEIDKHDTKVDPGNAVLLVVSLPDLKPGKYKVVWRALSVDTHVTNGSFTFDFSP